MAGESNRPILNKYFACFPFVKNIIKVNILFLRCKNFFKRSVVVVQTKPYVCANQQSCDVGFTVFPTARAQNNR